MSIPSSVLELRSPAKINLTLSVHGQRGDGFHELSSCMVAVDFGDRLKFSALRAMAISCMLRGLN